MLGLIPVIRVMHVTHVEKFGYFRSIIIIMSVMCVMRVSYDIHVMTLSSTHLKPDVHNTVFRRKGMAL